MNVAYGREHWLCATAILFGLLTAAHAEVPSAERPTIRSEADLPRFTYPVRGAALQLLTANAAAFEMFARGVRRDLDTMLHDYEFEDPGVLVRLLSDEVDMQVLFGEDGAALITCERMRTLVDRPDLKATGMFNDLSFLRARLATGRSDGELFQAEYRKDFGALVQSLPWDVVAPRVKKVQLKFQRLSVDYVKAQVEAEIEPYMSQHHALDFPLATKLIFWRGTLLTEVPQRQIVLDILSAYIAAHDSASVE
jgi:hypothetical protein